MLKFKIPVNLFVYFCLLNKSKFLITTIFEKSFKNYIAIPSFVLLEKNNNFLIVRNKTINSLRKKGFILYLTSFFNCFQIPYKKTLICRGLGIKITLVDQKIILRVGLSNTINIAFDKKKSFVLVNKRGVVLKGFDKTYIGLLAQNLFFAKAADCYKGKGLFFKGKPPVLKPIKKI